MLIKSWKQNGTTTMTLNEGGNIWADQTQRINRADVDPTLAWLEKVTGLDHVDFKLGSTGLKDTSGDLDIAVNPESISKEELVKNLLAWVKQNKPDEDPKQWIKKSGISVHFKTPINGDESLGFVQTDFMFGNPDWLKFFYRADADSQYKGMIRNVLLSSLAKAANLKINDKGLFSRDSNELVTFDPDETAVMLLGKGASKDALGSVEKIFQALANDPNKESKLSDFRDYAQKYELELPENTELNRIRKLAGVKAL